jgi:hypothetical protein
MKIKYEKPVLIDLKPQRAEAGGQCKNGSMANQCNQGASAQIHACNPTGASAGTCSTGNQAGVTGLLELLLRGTR